LKSEINHNDHKLNVSYQMGILGINIYHENESNIREKYIESFNSILEGEVIRRFEFTLFEEAITTIKLYIDSYNSGRLHSVIAYITSEEINIKCMEMKQKN